MSKRNPIEKSEYIQDRYREYLKSSFKFGNEDLQRKFEQQLEKENLFKGPYVSLNLPFERGASINDLIEEGVVSRSFSKLGDLHLDRPLYAHQEESIRRIGSGRSAIVTTGTGSGKTESFLFPILNELLFEVEKGNADVGVRAVFLYPMNALVNDQIDRVRKLLSTCPDITFGFFTGETKETIPAGYREKYAQEHNVVIPPNELLSREEIRNNPPHLLFTNYSMLEFLLIRPNDYAIFSPERLKHWKYVVLDEAHSYYGSLGIELSLLMRRLTGLAERKPRFILTSATLGEKGKSEKQIIDFASNLTSAYFDESDIIFAKRIPLDKSQIKYRIEGQDYVTLKHNLKSLEKIEPVLNKYGCTEIGNVSKMLFTLLSRDKNVYEIYELLKDRSKVIQSVLIELGGVLSVEEITALIDLINHAEYEGIGLYDLKYHSFVRPLAGAYVTLGNPAKLSLTKTNMIEEWKAFEVGNCRHCSTPYIIGRIRHNLQTNLDYLLQNDEVDIYENYGENAHVELDYFLLDSKINEEEADKDTLEEYIVCSKCGAIHARKNLKARVCECGVEYQSSIYRVTPKKRGEEHANNNIGYCPSCGHKSRSGIVKSLNLGKDEGTALIAQMLLEAIDEDQEDIQKKQGLSLKKKAKVDGNIPKSDRKVKQFLSFSDSRQQASFAAVFLESNHVRMLQKRLIWEIIKESNFDTIAAEELASRLTAKIKEKDLFPNGLSPHKNAWITMMIDLLRVDGAYDGQGLGLYHFDLDIQDIMEQIEEEDVVDAFGNYNITKADLATLIQVVLTVFKTTSAINYVKSNLTPEEKQEHLDYRRFDNYIMFHSEKAHKDIRSFLPIKGSENAVLRYVQKVCDCKSEEAKDILDIIFNNLIVEISQQEGAGKFLIKNENRDAYQIDVSRYVLNNYKNTQYYQCSKCGSLTPYNIHNCCTQDHCDGTLAVIDPDDALKMNYYRQQYKTKKIERIVIEEHTAQLDKKKARQYQQDFKDKKINILSCSTTFEMGIDIGDLETVYMRNVPPTPANYVQRAGRAGRRKDSSAYVLTYCGVGSHDYTYYSEPERMISGVINPPYFNVQNKKIIVRHLMAASLGHFFREYPGYFVSIDQFLFNGGVNCFNQYVKSKPEDLNQYINERVLPEPCYETYRDFKWFEDMGDEDEKLTYLLTYMVDLVKEYDQAKVAAVNLENYKEADYFSRQIENLHKLKVIDQLSKFCVIPKYGFPVDVVNLEVYNKDGKRDGTYDLNRDLRIAISEYAPDSEVIVNKKKFTSKYISLPKTNEFPRHYFCTCSNCQKVNVYVSTHQATKCNYCGEDIDAAIIEHYIEPIYGFKTGETKESTRLKPKRTYAGEVSYIGGGKKDEQSLQLGNVLKIETRSDDELLVMNRAHFYMCPLCGYSEKDNSHLPILETSRKHKNHRMYDCSNEILERLKIGHSFKTDVARITIPTLDSYETTSYAEALSFMYAFLEGVSRHFGIERTDIDGILELNLDLGSYDILLYDNVPGGAGHVKRLLNELSIVEALKVALVKVSQGCCDEDTSCYNCLRNYYNQKQHGLLKRVYARNIIVKLLNRIEQDCIE